MKKIFFLVVLFFSIKSNSQNIDTVNVSLTLRAQDWAWAVGKYGHGGDSLNRVRIRALRTAIIAANPPAWTTNVQINNVNGSVVMWIYNSFCSAGFGEVLGMGTNTAERTTIYTNIRAINNSALQYHIGVADASNTGHYIYYRNNGKTILMDN